jgi:glyoxylase-like metal-dependent hydrolase (beta-lactamase superfamily II)
MNWPEAAGCVYYEAPDAVALIDPLLPRGEEGAFLGFLDRDVERVGLPVVVLLTAGWHERDAPILRSRYEAEERLPGGIEVHRIEGAPEEQLAYFIRPHRALVVGEIFVGRGGGLSLCPSPRLIDRSALDRSLQSLLELPVERILTGYGEPVLARGRVALRLALRESLPAQAED